MVFLVLFFLYRSPVILTDVDRYRVLLVEALVQRTQIAIALEQLPSWESRQGSGRQFSDSVADAYPIGV